MSAMERIQKWYVAQCNGDWEHMYGIKIESLDNPGWWVEIEICCTKQAELVVDFKQEDIEIQVNDYVLIGTCNADSLEDLLNRMADFLGA